MHEAFSKYLSGVYTSLLSNKNSALLTVCQLLGSARTVDLKSSGIPLCASKTTLLHPSSHIYGLSSTKYQKLTYWELKVKPILHS